MAEDHVTIKEEPGQGNKGKAPPPSLNKFMHPRNIYRTPPSFKQLATKYPEFRKHCTYDINGKVKLDFKNPDALSALATCLLDKDFNLKVTIPPGRLVPTLPLRLNYLLWIEDLLALVKKNEALETICGMDVGTGSACVYPLLGTKQCNWCFLATEADDLNYNSAMKNIQENGLKDQIYLKKVASQTMFGGILDNEKVSSALESCRSEALKRKSLLPTSELQEVVEMHKMSLGEGAAMKPSTKKMNDVTGDSSYILEFMMCNPPFFSQEEDTDSMKKSKKDRGEPTSVLTGSMQELVVEGGEVAFITKMINESVNFKDKVRIFSTMIGSKVDVKEIKQLLSSINAAHIAFTEFCQGRTMRWGVAWTFNPLYPLETVLSKKQMMNVKPLVLLLPRSFMTNYSVTNAWQIINKLLKELKLRVRVFKNNKYFVGANIKAYKITWIHTRRKNREKQRKLEHKNENISKGDASEDEEMISQEVPEDVTETPDETDVLDLKRKSENCTDVESTPAKKIKHGTCEENEDNIGENLSKGLEEDRAGTVSLGMDPSPNDSGIGGSPVGPSDVSGTVGPSNDSPTLGISGPECVMRCNFHIKQTGGQISLEAIFLGGSLGKDGLNQLIQYIKNQIYKRN